MKKAFYDCQDYTKRGDAHAMSLHVTAKSERQRKADCTHDSISMVSQWTCVMLDNFISCVCDTTFHCVGGGR